MSRLRKIYNHSFAFILLVFLQLLFSVESCQQIEFEPLDILYITTDSIQFLDEENYELSGSLLNIGRQEITQHGFCWSNSGTPTTEGSNVELGSIDSIGKFSVVASGFELKSTYYVRAYAITNSGIEYGNEEYFRTRPPVIDSIVTDIDGNSYEVVVIGEQAWIAENLRTTHYADGKAIPLVQNDSAWDALTVHDKAYSWYDNNSSNAQYGAYYTWAAAMNGESGSNMNPSEVQGVCPDGWHLPSDAEWNQMHIHLGLRPDDADNIGFLGTRQRVGDKMKGIGDPLWQGLDWYSQYNESRFSALPVGQRNNTGIFNNVEKYTYFWSSAEFDDTEAWYRYLQRGHPAVLRVHVTKKMGFSVRCVLDQ